MKKYLLLALFILTFISFAHAAQKSRIELADGSTVEGEVVALSDGQYTVKSPSLGTFKIEASRVRNIRQVDDATGSSQKDIAPLLAAAMQGGGQKLPSMGAGNADIAKEIPALISNPDFLALAKDPEALNAAKSMDLKTLMANEKFAKLINSDSKTGGSGQEDKK
jgi:hypothetical protein